MNIEGRTLHPGHGEGDLLVLREPLSFWGGLDPKTGMIIDQSHPEVGQSLAGRVVAMPGSRGSSGTPGVLGEALRLGVGPAALVVTKADVNLIAGVIVAEALYGVNCPILQVAPHEMPPHGVADRCTIMAQRQDWPAVDD